jgi:2-oxoglutarate dehydrogenase E2 component (dihydrolipoamide succinyltransferase)
MPAIAVKVPKFPESVSEGTLSAWHKKPGQAVKSGEKIADIETDKIVIDVTAPADGVLADVREAEGATVRGEQVIAVVDPVGATSAQPEPSTPPPAPPAPPPATATATVAPLPPPALQPPEAPSIDFNEGDYSPAVRRLIKEHKLNPAEIAGHGKGGRITKADILRHLEHSPHLSREFGSGVPTAPAPAEPLSPAPMPAHGDRPVSRVKMSRLRARIAERLVEAQRTAAILSTFNEINMQAVMDIRARYKEPFEKEHGIKLGFMSFFVKAAVEALAKFPIINASVEGDEIVYHQYFDLGIAVSTPRGLVVPVLRNAEQLSLAEIEKQIADFAARAKDGKLSIEELSGGTFTISNGGVFGSLLSTPILNPPQSGILGLHRIQERPIAENGQVVIRPMMYVALSYDHRIIDGREAVQFLVALKEAIEDPSRLLLQI